jgi:hypothetical protein
MVLLLALPEAFAPMGEECWPLRTTAETEVAFVHVPQFASDPVEILYPIRCELVFAPAGLAMLVYPVARDGAVVDPSRWANTTMMSPARFVPKVAVLACADADDM